MRLPPKNPMPLPFQEWSDDAMWEALLRKDAKADGSFFHSVKTTGVYCRPSCPARTPLRKNVVFYASCEAAERAGFRACKRCAPGGPGLETLHADAVARACRTLERAEPSPTLDVLAKSAGMSRYHFHRVFREFTGLTPRAYAAACRARRVREELPRAASITEAIYAAGFQSNGRFYAESARMLGMNPTSFRAGGEGLRIHFAVGDCALGAVLVAASETGVCAIALADEADGLVKELQDQFPKADLIGGDRNFERTVARVIGFLEAPQIGLNLPLDIRGTAFQQRVWRALQQIPAGATVSYTELARRLGSPGSARAVAGACAANRIAVAIPCHRVVRQDGSLSGYRWGVARKRALLCRESAPGPLSQNSGK